MYCSENKGAVPSSRFMAYGAAPFCLDCNVIQFPISIQFVIRYGDIRSKTG